MSYIGFDAKELKRQNKDAEDSSKGFISSIGGSIETFSLSKFDSGYDKAIAATLEHFGIERKRKIYYFQYFAKLFNSTEMAHEIGIFFLKKLKEYIIGANIYFVNIPPSRIPRIYMYAMDPPQKVIPTKDFLSTLTPQFSYMCAWRYTKEMDDTSTILLDHFQGKQTISWSVFWYKKPVIYYKGDQCNSLISAADILVGVMDESLHRKAKDINIKEMKNILHKEIGLKGNVYVIGSKDLRWIVPITRRPIDTTKFIKHPIFFIISEERPSQLEYKEAKDQLSFSPVYDIVTTAAAIKNGCVKQYDVTEDYKILKNNDRLIYFGEKGKEIARNLESQYGVKRVFDFRIEKEKIE